MRLLHVDTLEFKEFFTKNDTPKYVIASHRWVKGETTFKDVLKSRNTDAAGYEKVQSFARFVKEHVSPVEWLWIDTCCIDKDSAAELSESINLMFEWYRNAELCLAYLYDVESVVDLERSEWFTRGWTLQELLAPPTIVFLNRSWQVMGNKGAAAHAYNGCAVGPSLEPTIKEVTRIPECVLHDYSTSFDFSNDAKHHWMDGRTTTREEDMFYALYGIFGVSPGANYGEGQHGAKQRLVGAINQNNCWQHRKWNTLEKSTGGSLRPIRGRIMHPRASNTKIRQASGCFRIVSTTNGRPV